MPNPNHYVLALQGEYSPWSYDEEQAPTFRGAWREKAFGVSALTKVDLEIGTGNGLHFAHRSNQYPERCVIGLELRYKPLIQSIRRVVRAGGTNARIARYNAYLLPELFVQNEIDDVFIFFPDPWEKSRNHKHRIIQDEFLKRVFEMQRSGCRVYFKTDSRDYFEWALTRFQRSAYEVEAHTFDLHHSEFAQNNFITQFEQIFIRQGLAIGYACLKKP